MLFFWNGTGFKSFLGFLNCFLSSILTNCTSARPHVQVWKHSHMRWITNCYKLTNEITYWQIEIAFWIFLMYFTSSKPRIQVSQHIRWITNFYKSSNEITYWQRGSPKCHYLDILIQPKHFEGLFLHKRQSVHFIRCLSGCFRAMKDAFISASGTWNHRFVVFTLKNKVRNSIPKVFQCEKIVNNAIASLRSLFLWGSLHLWKKLRSEDHSHPATEGGSHYELGFVPSLSQP